MAEILDKKNKLISDLCSIKKTIDDFLYGTIQFSRFASEVIDTVEFQRLRNMRQLGLASFVFPNAMHTRFEHSLGTYFQCKELTKRLADVTPESEMSEYLKAIPELNEYIDKNYKNKKCEFDKYIQELVNIAALCHDLGHGPFSHLFDDIFINDSELKEHENARHEKRSQLLIEMIIKKSAYLSVRISNDHIKLIQNIVDPPKNAVGFIYQIVSNNSNSLDVDKFDYITRDMEMIGKHSSFDYKRLITQVVITNNILAYPKDCQFDIWQLFNMRHTMHRQVYNHPGVVSAQLTMADLMKKINKLLNISESIKDMNKFCKFTDSFIIQYPEFLSMTLDKMDNEDPNTELIKEIISTSNKIKTHTFYNLIYASVWKNKTELAKEDIFKEELSQYLDDIIIHSSVVGFVSGDKPNPLDNLYSYDYDDIKFSNDNKVQYIGNQIQKNKHGITNLISNEHQEYLIMIFFKKSIDEKLKENLKRVCRNYAYNYDYQSFCKHIEI
jgi:deoxynucleoside triphosphate triphosphohydrolase SAMHD1